jgi:hypothetical protein
MTATAPTPLMSVNSGQTCVGFIINSGRDGYAAFDAEERCLGKFATVPEAVSAVINTSEAGRVP